MLDGAALLELVDGLSDNYLLDYDYVVTGYIGKHDMLCIYISL